MCDPLGSSLFFIVSCPIKWNVRVPFKKEPLSNNKILELKISQNIIALLAVSSLTIVLWRIELVV
jgi:hypothetical protein